MLGENIKIGNRRVWMHKAINHPDFASESVLTRDPWSFVELWLKRQNKSEALSFWSQALRFHEAAKYIDVEASPLSLYYSFLNATKALLVVRGATHAENHGVTGDRPAKAKASLANEAITFKSGGILPALCTYLGESTVTHTAEKYNLKDLLWNVPFVHRAFLHTFRSAPELFIPLESACYVKHPDPKARECWFQAEVSPRYADGRMLRNIPHSFEWFTEDGRTYIRRKKRFNWWRGKAPQAEKLLAQKRLGTYHSKTRRIIVPISGNRDLWYIKRNLSSNPPSERHGLTIIFAAMHRLSELARYDPNGLERHLYGTSNWLITEFMTNSADQFIDQMASEITGFQFWRPAIRTP